MMTLCSDVLKALRGKTLATAESCTGGGIGAAITAVSGASKVFVGGVISYTNEVKNQVLGVEQAVLDKFGAVSAPVAGAMASGVRNLLKSDVAVSVTGLAGPGGDDFGNPVGTVCIGYADRHQTLAKQYRFYGDRDDIRQQSIRAALELILEMLQ
ncbi:MAG: CinA family protein [Oscillospiraceae bacterium]|nr:CinA family protein [Oscillospiraceae bacterium]